MFINDQNLTAVARGNEEIRWKFRSGPAGQSEAKKRPEKKEKLIR